MLGVGFRIGLCALALALSACGTLSVQEEKQMGAQAQSQLRKQLTFVRDPVTGVLTQPITENGYGLVGAGVIWKPNDAWTVSLQGSNLTDKQYKTTGYVVPALGVRSGFYGPPRQYTLSVKYDF